MASWQDQQNNNEKILWLIFIADTATPS